MDPSPSIEKSIQQRFGAAAPAYAESAVHRAGDDLAAIVAAGVRTGRERVLDVGCGAGHTAHAFAEQVAEVVALDLTPAMLEQTAALARERGLSNVSVQQGDAADLPFPDAHFDVVTSRLCAHHYARPAEAVREASRVLKPGGLFLLSDTVAPEDPARDTFLNAFEVLRDPSHVRNHKVSEWEAMFRAAGFAFAKVADHPIHQEFDPWVERIGTPEGAVVGLRALFDAVSEEVRRSYDIAGDGDYAFRLDLAVLQGTLD